MNIKNSSRIFLCKNISLFKCYHNIIIDEESNSDINYFTLISNNNNPDYKSKVTELY